MAKHILEVNMSLEKELKNYLDTQVENGFLTIDTKDDSLIEDNIRNIFEWLKELNTKWLNKNK